MSYEDIVEKLRFESQRLDRSGTYPKVPSEGDQS